MRKSAFVSWLFGLVMSNGACADPKIVRGLGVKNRAAIASSFPYCSSTSIKSQDSTGLLYLQSVVLCLFQLPIYVKRLQMS